MTRPQQLNAYMQRHWPLAGLVVGILTSLGFQSIGPGKRLDRVEARVDTLAVQLERLSQSTDTHQTEILRKIDLLITAQCTETRNPVARRALNCPNP